MKNYLITQGFFKGKKTRSYWTKRKNIGNMVNEFEPVNETINRIKRELINNEYIDYIRIINSENNDILLEEKKICVK